MNDPKLREKFGAGKMSDDMHCYDVFPKVFIENEPTRVTIKPLGWHAAFEQGHEYTVFVQPRNDRDYATISNTREESLITTLQLTPDEDGCIRFDFTFTGEQPWYIIFDEIIGKKQPKIRLSVYSLHADMKGRYPFRGDLHLHSNRSDGREDPAIVAANFRKGGYDFLAITDHHRYYGSLEAIEAYKDVKIDLNLCPGEECHLPDNRVHIVNFGGLWSVASQVESCLNNAEFGTDASVRSFTGETRPIMTDDEFRAEVMKLADELDIPEGIDRYTYAACVWEFRKIREADGLAIFCHPYWIQGGALNVPENLTDALFDSGEFDAFELLGGETYLEQNEYQVFKYTQARARGLDFPVVGSSDGHSTINNPGWNVGATVVFAPENERKSLIESIKDKYTVCIDNISREPRLAGDFRFVQFGRFLLEYYFPLHDELCFEEGRLMKDYRCGDKKAGELLDILHGRVEALQKKYFAY